MAIYPRESPSSSGRTGSWRTAAALGMLMTGAGLLASSTMVTAAQRATNQQRTYVSVVDKDGNPVVGLAADDFTVREDGRTREVISVEPATEAMQIALLVDTSTAVSRSIRDIRQGLKAFAHAIWAKSPDSQIALYSFGERPGMLANYSSSDLVLERQIDRLFAESASGAYLIDAIVDAAPDLRKQGSPRSMMVAYVDENGPEFSNRRSRAAFEALSSAHASLWTVARQGANRGVPSDEDRARSIVLGEVTARTGGRSATVFGGAAIKDRMSAVAEQLLGQWVVTYGRPESLIPPEELEVKLTNSDWRLAAPRWTSR